MDKQENFVGKGIFLLFFLFHFPLSILKPLRFDA